MPAVHLKQLSYRYTTAAEVITGADVHIGPGWTGVVGTNGAGKTTFLRLIAGQLAPTSGTVVVEPADGPVVLCEQTVDHLTPAIRAFADSWDGSDVSLRGRLGLDPYQLDRWLTLSPGERKRWQVGAALSQRPDVLLLDEPTNHLDSEARSLLVAALQRHEGVGLVVSHDRALLEELTIRTIRVEKGKITVWNGSYRAASEGWSAVEAKAAAERARLKAKARSAERHLADLRRVNEQKRAAFRRKNNTASFKDIDARSAARGSKHAEGEKAAGKALAAAANASERATTEAAAAGTVRRAVGGDLYLDFEPSPKRVVASHDGPLVAGGETILDHVDMAIGRTDRIWLRGRNGIGKTTLLRSLASDAALPPDKLLWLEQELTPEQVDDLVEQLGKLDRKERGRVLSLVATLGVDPEVLLASQLPSPGEARKLSMALGLGRSAWLVLLDEPTNHLDLPSIERLQRALASYPGALVVVSHDDEFAGALGLTEFDLGR
jgi:ATPase subunit of ABC transporter with duplicated ATPase domains